MRKFLLLTAICILMTGCTTQKNEDAFSESTVEQTETIAENRAEDFDYEEDDGTISIVRYNGQSETVKIPEEIDGKKVTEIGDMAFYENVQIKYVEVPNGIIEIGDNAFQNCRLLEKIEIPKTVKEIGMNAFDGTFWLENSEQDFVTVGDGFLYEYKGAETEIIVPQTVKIIGEYSFSRNNIVQSITADSVEKVEDNSFWDCKNLKNVKLKSVKEISDNAFSGCELLEDVELSENLLAIGDWAFLDCKKLKVLKLSETLEEIEENTFNGCENLVLKVKENSFAHEYAQKNNIDYEITD